MSNDQDDFWGDDPKWDTDPSGALPTRGNTGAAIKSWWSSLLGAGAGASAHRSHGSSSGSDTPADELAADPYDLVGIGASDDVASDDVVSDDGAAATMAADINATTEIPVVRAGGEQADWDAAWDSADDRGSAPVDPLLARMGALAIVVTLLVPIGLSMRSGGGDDLIESAVATESSAVTSPTVVVTVEAEPVATAESSTEETSAAPAADSTAAPAAVAEPASSTASETSAAEAPAEATAERSGGDETLDTSAAAGEAADRVERPCPIEYEVVQGDFWIRLAGASDVPLDDLLSVNGASTRSPLFPGETICLPAGATIPPPPVATTTAPTTTAAPTTTTTAATTTTSTTTTTTAPPTTTPAGPEAIKQLIRDIWPDELEDKALEVAYRESRYVPTADNNFCCYGLFQIYWNVHRSWLGEVGVNSVQDLFDPELNTRAAYALYQRAGGWGPWGG